MQRTLEGLNREQREAVTSIEGPLLVLAGAGTGKTRVITVRIAWMLAHGIAPENVLAVTFTNKAAREMRERVAALVGAQRAQALTVGTFHAFCARTLREHAGALGLARSFTIADEADQLAALRGALRELAVPEARVQPAAARAIVSLAKNRMQSAEQFLAAASDDREELVGRAWQRYEERLRRSNALDFDDLLVWTVRLLVTQRAARDALRKRFRHVLVDEYQDTNAPQYEILLRLTEKHRNLCAVGDDDQSIYGWRGADVRKILSFERDFTGCKVVRLETNYRSTEPILAAANAVIRHNSGRHAKTLRSAVGPGEPVRLSMSDDEMGEADHVVREIQELVRTRRAQPGDVAILFRTAVQPRPFEAVLRSRNVPYVLIGGMSFFDRKEVRDVLALLRTCVNPADEAALLRVINVPPRGLGKGSIEKLLAACGERGATIPELVDAGGGVPGVSDDALSSLREQRARLAPFALEGTGARLPERVSRAIEAAGYREEVERSYPDAAEREQRWAAVQEILNFAENCARQRPQTTLATFLEELALGAEERDEADERRGQAVTLMTLHSAKGLEFPRVYLVGLEEGLLPHERAAAEDTIEEERRLCYVGITRARESLTLTLARSRAKNGRRIETHPSRFLLELRGEAPPKGWRAAGANRAETELRPASGARRNSRAVRPPGARGSDRASRA